MVVENHYVGPVNYKNKYGRVLLMTRKWALIEFPGLGDEKIALKKLIPYTPPKREITGY
jgi:hypothetical protein